MSAPAKTNELDPLLHPVQFAKLLGVSSSWALIAAAIAPLHVAAAPIGVAQ
jgi:hypothetical protein